MYQYPYGNAQQLNLDWILGKIQELEAGSTEVNIEEVANALVSASFDAGVSYRKYDYCFYNGKLYRALNDTTGAFNPSDWLEVVIGDDIPVLTRLLNAVDTSLTSLQTTVGNQGNAITTLQTTAVTNVRYNGGFLKKTINGSDANIIQVQDTPTNDSAKLPSSKAVYNLSTGKQDKIDIITQNQNPISCAAQASTTLITFNLTEGTWIIICFHDWTGNYPATYTDNIINVTDSDIRATLRNNTMGNGGGATLSGFVSIAHAATVTYTTYNTDNEARTAQHIRGIAFKIA